MNSSGPSPKKAQIDSTDQKSLMDLPEEVIEMIFTFTELADMKSLSETCKSLNTIFSQRTILNKVALVVKNQTDNEKEALSSSTRSYTNLHWNAPMPISVWKHLSSNLTRLRIKFSSSCVKDLFDSVIAALPFLTELTHLDFSDNDWIMPHNASHQLKTIKPVALKKLKHLEISFMSIRHFYDRFIQIESENLHSIILQEMHLFSGQNDCYDAVRDLIKRQKNLKVLRLFVKSDFFDQAFVIDSKLRELKWTAGMSNVTRAQEANICDFVTSQNELEIVDINYLMLNPSARLKNFTQWPQLLKLKRMSLKSVTLDQVKHHQQMSSVEELSVEFDMSRFSAAEVQNIFAQIATKFPNVINIAIKPYLFDLSIDFSLVNSLDNIKELKYDTFKNLKLLKSKSLPLLESFTIKITSADEYDALIDFIARHNTIKKLDVFCISNEIDFAECVIRAALTHLNNLKSLSLNWMLSQPELDIDSNFHRNIFALISEQAKPGFVYRCQCDQGTEIHQILKRDGGKLVRMQNGRWAEM